jgi:aminoglycoside 3-N-acetyltransferase
MVTYSDLKLGLTRLGLTSSPVIVHASLKAFGYVEGGPDTMLRILLASARSVVMPAFTYKTMLTPEVGPPNNGITYGRESDLNKMAEPFDPDMPADKMMGVLAETLRQHPSASRTSHPILSFIGIGADSALNTQTLYHPLAPIGVLAEQAGWVLLMGVDQTVNTAIHYAEKLAGRKQFIRWALTKDRVLECPSFPGDSAGFQAIAPILEKDSRFVKIGNATIQAIPLTKLVEVVTDCIRQDPLALLCQREDCERCNEVQSGLVRDYYLRTHRRSAAQ